MQKNVSPYLQWFFLDRGGGSKKATEERIWKTDRRIFNDMLKIPHGKIFLQNLCLINIKDFFETKLKKGLKRKENEVFGKTAQTIKK